MHLIQVGAGSGGIVVLDLLARDPAVTRVTVVEPDVYKPHNVHRHLFPPAAVGRPKADLAAEWLRQMRPDLAVETVSADLTDPARQADFAARAAGCDVGVCAVDNEPAKFAFDALMRTAGKPWALGEVLSGGIGGWVHRFVPGGPCYGCVASHLQRTVAEEPAGPAPDYSAPGGPVPEATVPANKASIGVIASLHAVVTLDLLRGQVPEFTSVLFSLARVPGVFDEAFRTYRFRIPRAPGCLVCGSRPEVGGDLDVAVGEALGRLGPG
ncbi:MAG: thiamine biosynthesis protein ThiF [Isosphaera sp.]|nr:thiamine biosynthesis protein ThiF [Isosphaera sp.]